MATPYSKSSSLPPVCRFHQQGSCTKTNCQFRHIISGRASCPSAVLPTVNASPAGTARPAAIVPRPGQVSDGVLGTVLRLLFEKQQVSIYDPFKHALHLNAFRSCPDLRDITSAVDFNVASFCESLCRIIAEVVRPAPTLISIDDNHIRSLHHFARALERHGLHAGLRGLSARGNMIDTTDFTNQLKGFVNLGELVLIGNPVTRRPEYKKKVRLHLPNLQGLDMESIHPAPLRLPWPVDCSMMSPAGRTTYADARVALLSLLNEHFFSPLPQPGGTDAVVPLYAPSATFALTLEDINTCALQPPTTQSTSAEIVKIVMQIRQRMIGSDANSIRGVRNGNHVVGPSEIVARMCSTLFPSASDKIAVRQSLHPSPSVEFLEGEHVKVPMAIVTAHGVLEWSLPQFRNVPPQRRPFVRTLALVLDSGARLGWLITSDSMLLTKPPQERLLGSTAEEITANAMLFNASAPARLDFFSRQCGVTVDVARAAAAQCSSDAQLKEVLTDLSYASESLLAECAAVAAGDTRAAIAVARVANQLSVAPSAAAERLQTAAAGGGDPAQLAAEVIAAHRASANPNQ